MTPKGNCSVWQVCHKHNGLNSEGYSELIFTLILFAPLLKRLPELFWPREFIPKKVLSCKHHLHSRAYCEPPLPLYCSLIIHNVKIWLPVQPACMLLGPADGRHMCAQHLHFIALIRTVNKMRAFPPLLLSWYKWSHVSSCFISVPVISRWFCF